MGGGDLALQEALTVANHAAHVIVVHQGAAFSAQQAYQQRVVSHAAISVRYNTIVDEILGEAAVTGVRLRDVTTGEVTEVEVAGVFVAVGLEPNTAFLKDSLHLTQSGRIPTDSCLRTELRGVFAAGDVRQHIGDLAIMAAGDGATAAIAAHQYLTDGAWPGA